MLQDSRSFQETFWNTGCRKLIVRTGAGAVYWKARDKSGLACRSHAARSLDRWVAGSPDLLLLLPPNARHTYSRNPLDLLLTPWLASSCCWWMRMMADAEERGGRGNCESAGETSNINSGEILLHRRISWHPAPAWISTFTFTGFLLLHFVEFYLYICWHRAPAWISTFTFSLLNYWSSNLKTCETCYCICSKILSPFKLRVSLSLDVSFQQIVFISCWLDISKSGFRQSWSCPAKISPLNSAEDFAHINIMTVGFPSCATTIIIAHQLWWKHHQKHQAPSSLVLIWKFLAIEFLAMPQPCEEQCFFLDHRFLSGSILIHGSKPSSVFRPDLHLFLSPISPATCSPAPVLWGKVW